MNYRNPQLLALAKYAPRCMKCGCDNHGQIVMAHANWEEFGKGMSIKAHDCFIAALCWKCHKELDQGLRMSKLERFDDWLMAFIKTWVWLFTARFIGVLKIRP